MHTRRHSRRLGPLAGPARGRQCARLPTFATSACSKPAGIGEDGRESEGGGDEECGKRKKQWPEANRQGAGAGRFAWLVAARPVSKMVVVSDDGWETYKMVADTRTAARMNAAEAMHWATQLS